MMERFDVLVVGGGPAGSTAAIRLADAGAKVLLVDKARFPRDKPCGGGLTIRAVRQCPVDPSPVVEEEIDVVELRFRYRDTIVRHAHAPVIRMTQRRRLDAFLLDHARERGVQVREGTTIDATAAPVDWVIAADGANGTTARAFGLGDGIVHGVAYEGNARYGAVARERYAHRAIVELADIPGGYGWVFAKGDHVNVGVGAWQSEGPKIREHLKRICLAHQLDPEQLESVRGHRLPLRPPGVRIAGERTLLVGDAGGLIDPVSGDGMYECFVSSRLAVEAILCGSTAGYQAAVDAELGPLHRASWAFKHAFDRWPRASWRVVRTQVLWRTVERLLLGELSAPQEQHGLRQLPLRALDVLGRT